MMYPDLHEYHKESADGIYTLPFAHLDFHICPLPQHEMSAKELTSPLKRTRALIVPCPISYYNEI